MGYRSRSRETVSSSHRRPRKRGGLGMTGVGTYKSERNDGLRDTEYILNVYDLKFTVD